MGMIDQIFRRPKINGAMMEYFQTLTSYRPQFTSFSGGLYEMDITRSAVNAFATHCSKLKPEVIGPATIAKIWRTKPNPWQTTSQFLARCATIFEVENTLFIAPMIDEKGRIFGYWPVLPSYCELVEDKSGTLYIRYHLKTGQAVAVEFDLCAVLTQRQYKDDIFGESNRALNTTLQLINIQNQGITEGVKSAASIRFLAKLGNSLRPEDVKAEQKRFRETNLSADNNGGVLMFDQRYADVKQIESKPYIVDDKQMMIINQNVYSYFGCNEKILRNEWDDVAWNAYYEGKVEPFAVQLALALTAMTFSEREQSIGNQIMFSANRLQFAPPKAKTDVITSLFDRGMLNRDEGREIMQMPPLPNGEGQKYYIRGEYIESDKKTITEAGEGDENNAGEA